MTFSWAQAKLHAVEIKVRRAKTQARAQHKDMKMLHPQWCVEASKGQYTLLTKFITDECHKAQHRQETFTTKLHQDG